MQKIISILTIITILLTSTSMVFADETEINALSTKVFSDVSDTFWGNQYINYLSSKDIINGFPDGTFKPQANVKINEFITMTVKALGYTFESDSTDWAKPYIDKAMELGIIKQGEFPSYTANINREQMASISVGAILLKENLPSTDLSKYVQEETTDFYKVSDDYFYKVIYSYRLGVITGFTDHSFKPQDYSTRAQASTVISKIINKSLRTPFERTDARYTMVPVSVLDEFGENLEVEQALYAPLLNGKPVTEIIDIAEILKTSAKQEGKGFLRFGSMQLSDGFGITGYQSKEYHDEILSYEGLERAMAYAERADFNFYVRLDDITNNFNPYRLGMNKKFTHAINDPLFSTYFFRRYEAQVKPIFQYLFGSDFDRAWALLKTGLDDKSEGTTTQITINGRFVSLVSSYNTINLTISLKK